MTDSRLLPWQSSPAVLASDGDLNRMPRNANRARPREFFDKFDGLTLFYDAFWHHDGQRVLLVGPTPRNLLLHLHAGEFLALPSRQKLKPRFHISVSVMIAELPNVPPGTTAIALRVGGQTFELPVQPSSVPALAGSRVLFSMNKDNDLAWIREWAAWHAKLHGTDAVILFDNGSTRYSRDDVVETLLSVPGLNSIAVPSWPYKFGPIDPSVMKDPYWSRFAQPSSMSVMLRRYGAKAFGLLNADIDELTLTESGDAYAMAKASRGGIVVYRGQWVEAAGSGPDHASFRQRLVDPAISLSGQRKWVLDTERSWIERLSVHPYWHWIEGRPPFSKSMPAGISYRHFKAINTNWKSERTAWTNSGPIETDTDLDAAFMRRGNS